jgi:hypothetical protein
MGDVLGNHWGPRFAAAYRTNVGPMSGPFRLRDAPETIAVLDAKSGEVIGTATRLEHAPAGVAMWRLVVRDVEVEGPWSVVYREFVPYHPRPPVLPPGPDTPGTIGS